MATFNDDFTGAAGAFAPRTGWTVEGNATRLALDGNGAVSVVVGNGQESAARAYIEASGTSVFAETLIGPIPASEFKTSYVTVKGVDGYSGYGMDYSHTYGSLYLRDTGGSPIGQFPTSNPAGKLLRLECEMAPDNLTMGLRAYLDGVLVLGPMNVVSGGLASSKRVGFASSWQLTESTGAILSFSGGELVADVANPTLTGAITTVAKSGNFITFQAPEGSDDIGVTKREWRIDGGAWVAGTSAKTYPGLTPSTSYTAEYRVGDRAGKYSAILSKTESTSAPDVTAPTLTAANVTLVGLTGATGGVTTTEPGPAKAVLTGSATPPSQEAFNAATGVNVATATLAAGANPDAFAFSGLATYSTFHMHVRQDDLAEPVPNRSAIATAAAPFSTPAPAVLGTKTYTTAPGALLSAGRPAPAARKVTEFSLTNWGTSASPVLQRLGQPLARDDVPAMHTLEIRRSGGAPIAAQFDEIARWKNGSMKFAVVHLRDTDLPAGETRIYEVWAKPGAADNTGGTTLATVATNLPLRCEITNHKTWDGTTLATKDSGAALALFATHAAVPTRVQKVHSGPVCEGWKVWGMVKDGAGGAGAEDDDLKVTWHVDVWKDAAGAIVSYEHAAVLMQDWFNSPTKTRRDYDLAYKNGATLVQNYAAVQHPYHAHWITCQMQDDHNHAKRQWTTATPTLLYKPDRAYWLRSKLMPPYDLDATPYDIPPTNNHQGPAQITSLYTPGGYMGHRPGVNDPGAYMGRGQLPDFDVRAFLLQTPWNTRAARACSLAGLGFPGHFRDKASDGADTSNKLIPLLFDPKPASASTFPGLPAPRHAYINGAFPYHTEAGGPVLGGQGAWEVNAYIGDMSHGVAYCSFFYLLEGERFMYDAVLDLAMNTVTGNADSMPVMRWAQTNFARQEMVIPTNRWAAISNAQGQERGFGLACGVYAYAVALAPENDVQTPYLKAWMEHNNDYVTANLRHTPPSARRAGLMWTAANSTRATWMTGFGIQGGLHVGRMCEVPGYTAYGAMMVPMLAAIPARALYDTLMDRHNSMAGEKNYNWDAPFLAPDRYFAVWNVRSDSGGADLVVTGKAYYAAKVGDECTFFSANSFVPTNTEEGEPLFIVSADGGQYGGVVQVSRTLGGTPLAIPAGNYALGGRWTGGNAPGLQVAAFPPYLPGADSYAPILMASLAFAEDEKVSTVPVGTTATMRTFLQNVEWGWYAGWSMKPVTRN